MAQVTVWIQERKNPKHYRVWTDDPRYFSTYTSHFTLEEAEEQVEYEKKRYEDQGMACVLASYGNTVGRPRVEGLPIPESPTN